MCSSSQPSKNNPCQWLAPPTRLITGVVQTIPEEAKVRTTHTIEFLLPSLSFDTAGSTISPSGTDNPQVYPDDDHGKHKVTGPVALVR